MAAAAETSCKAVAETTAASTQVIRPAFAGKNENCMFIQIFNQLKQSNIALLLHPTHCLEVRLGPVAVNRGEMLQRAELGRAGRHHHRPLVVE